MRCDVKVLFYGNCQTEVVMAAIAANNPDLQVEYAGNSNRVVHFDPERTARLMARSDHIITQPVMNTENPDHHTVLRARFADKITFMPYIWIDGLFSVCGLPESRALARSASFVGQTHVSDHLEEVGYQQTLQDFRNGLIDFQHRQRFENSMGELANREAFCDVQIAPFVRDTYRDRVVMLTHNHPHPVVVSEIARQIAARLGLRHAEIHPQDHAAYSAITLPEFGKIFSPFVAADLGLRHDYDLQWQRRGQEIIAQIADGMDGLTDRPSRQDLQAKTIERKDLIDERQAQNEALKAGSEEVRAQNAERQVLLAEKQAQSEALKDQNAERQALIAEKQAQTEALKAQADEHKAQIEVLRAQNAERHALNAERQAQIEVMKAQVLEKQALIAQRQAHKEAVRARKAEPPASEPAPPGSRT